MLERVPRRTVLGVSGAGITTFVLPGAASAASFEGTTLGSTGPDLLALSTADAGDGTHDVVLTVTLTDSGGDPYPDAARVDMTVGDDQGDPTSTTVDGEATGTASKLATTGTVTFAVAFPSYGDHQFTVATTPAAASHPSGITLLYTHSGLPGAPTSPSGTAGDGQVALTWTAPDDTGGLTLDRYETRYSSDGGSTWSSWATTGSITTAVTVTGLDDGTGYVFQVRAVNANGAGDASTSTTTLTPTGTPGAPTSVAGTPGDEQVDLTWSAPIDDGGLTISRYETRYSSDSGSNWSAWTTTGSSGVSATVTGLTNGTAYVFQVRAANDNGTGDASTTSTAVTPRTTPAAPTITGVTAGNEELSVAFTAGSDNGESIDNYEYELDASGTWTALSPADTTSPLTITGLTNETTYAVRIRAVNAAGSGAVSNSVDATPTSGVGWQVVMMYPGKKLDSGSWSSSTHFTAMGSPGTSSFRTATAASTGATGRTGLGDGAGAYQAFFTQTGITKIALVDGSSSSLDPTTHTNHLIYDLVSSSGSESLYDILLRLDTYQSTATLFDANDSVWGSASVVNHTAGTNGYSGTLTTSGGTGFRDNTGTLPGRFCVMGINRDFDNDIQALCAFSGDLQSGKGDSWRGSDPSQTFWSYWGHDFHSNSQTQRIGSSLQTAPGVATSAAWTGDVYLLAYSE